MQEIKDEGVQNSCLNILSGICREHVILPRSCIIFDILVREERWKTSGVADIHTGRLGRTNVCIKVFRPHEEHKQVKIKAVSIIVTSFGKDAQVLL